MRILIIAGTFNAQGGKSSGYAEKVWRNINDTKIAEAVLYNGGYPESLPRLMDLTPQFDTVWWWADVPNDLPKIVEDIKTKYPRTFLVTAKNNRGDRYGIRELVMRALKVKANLAVIFTGTQPPFAASVLDPLGNVWGQNFITSPTELATTIILRLKTLMAMSRVGTTEDPKWCEQHPQTADLKAFLDVVRSAADTFHELVNPPEGQRLLGNASFRCSHGFPSMKSDAGTIYVSQRNIDKRSVDASSFVPVRLGAEKEGVRPIVYGRSLFFGEKPKPSVDSPVQLHLYEKLPKIRFMLHGHVYMEHAPFTSSALPCGALEEVEDIMSTLAADYDGELSELQAACVNLRGHGCLLLGADPAALKDMMVDSFYTRPTPELQRFEE